MYKYDIYLTNKLSDSNPEVVKLNDFLKKENCVRNEQNPDIVFVFGGDGSLLNAIKIHNLHPTMFLLINAGTLGFYKEYDLADVDRLINEFNFDELIREEHHLLEVSDAYGNKAYAVNEVMVASSVKTLSIDVFINNNFLFSCMGSGVCISSPFGSTGYNHSLGGSLLTGDLGMILTLVAPIHNAHTHPLINSLVVADKDEIQIEVKKDTKFELAGDMKYLDNLQGNSFIISKSQRFFYLVHTKKIDEYQRIRHSFIDEK